MLLYVIPFILLLVVAIVLKKREDANKENANANKKTNNKKATKKNVARTARTSQRQQTNVVEDDIVVKQATKPLNADLKKSIEKLLAEKNYFSAEAKINQALNQDNAQHELYLYLLDVHLAQKDEFAVNQLINHIRSLGLEDIAAQAEAKQKATQVANPIESIAFESAIPSPIAPEAPKNTAAFDALIDNTEAKTSAEPTSTVAPLEFSTPVIQEKIQVEPIQPLEFNLGTTTEKDNTITSDLSLDHPTPIEKTQPEHVEPLEFSFTPSTSEVAAPTELAPEFKLDFAEPSVTPVQETAHDLEFKLTPSEEPQPTFSFDLENKTEVSEQTPSLNFEAPTDINVAAPIAVESNDPLVTSFPELAQVNEIQLNLDLAQQYIDLGAYASAREILSQNADQFSPAQREQSQSLLNRIAS